MENKKRTDVNELGEFGLIEHLTKDRASKNQSTIKSIGDDAAVIANGDLMTVISTDMLVEGIHFDLMYSPLQHLGYKAIAVNVSDICAMNAIPKQVTVSIALSNRFSVEALEELYQGIYAACDKYNVDLVGGDTTSAPKGLIISVTAVGQCEKERLVYRSGAKVGDLICISGDLGAAYLGLQLLEREKQVYLANPGVETDLEGQNYLVGRQLKPEARKDVVDIFRKVDLVPTSMIDVSDGLASELFHICTQSGVGAFLEESGVSLHPDTEEMALKFKIDPITCALNGGEDYELLFTINQKDYEKIKNDPNLTVIGHITKKSQGINLIGNGNTSTPLKAQGWNHFNK